VLDPATEILGKIIADPKSAPRGAPCRPRSIIQNDAIHQRSGPCQFDRDLSAPRVEARMLRGIGYEPVNNQSEPPASLWFERKRFGCKCQPDIHSIQQRTAHGAPHHADVCRGVDQRLAPRHCERLLHIGITMQQFDHVA
jgi:hypothetical protein